MPRLNSIPHDSVDLHFGDTLQKLITAPKYACEIICDALNAELAVGNHGFDDVQEMAKGLHELRAAIEIAERLVSDIEKAANPNS